MQYKYTAYKHSKLVAGDVVEVGLGEGDIARTVTKLSQVKTYTNYERDLKVVDKFNKKNKKRNKKHKIISKDFLKEGEQSNKFDVAIVDTFVNRSDYKLAEPIIIKLIKTLRPGGKIILEYQGDFKEENELRAFMLRKYGSPKFEHLNTGRPGDSKHIAYYEIK